MGQRYSTAGSMVECWDSGGVWWMNRCTLGLYKRQGACFFCITTCLAEIWRCMYIYIYIYMYLYIMYTVYIWQLHVPYNYCFIYIYMYTYWCIINVYIYTYTKYIHTLGDAVGSLEIWGRGSSIWRCRTEITPWLIWILIMAYEIIPIHKWVYLFIPYIN